MKIPEIDSLYELAALKGTNLKKAFLEDHRDDDRFKECLNYILNTQEFTSGISDKKLAKTCSGGTVVHSMHQLLDYLKANSSGKDADVATVQKYAAVFDEKTRKGIYKVVSQRWNDLGVGVTVSNNVYGSDFIPDFSVMLCEKFLENPDYFDGRKILISPKLDGFRMIAIKDHGNVEMWSRGGKRVEGFPDIEAELKALSVDNVVFDGERQPLGFESMSNKEQFKAASTSSKKGEKHGMCMAVYDYMPLKDWQNKKCNLTHGERYSTYNTILKGCKFVVPVKALYIGEDTSKIYTIFEEERAKVKEGIIIKSLDGMYEFERTKECMKLKAFYDADVVVTGMNEGTGRHKGRLGALVVDWKGNELRIGTGFSDEQRTEFWGDKSLIGKVVEFVYMETSVDKTGKESCRHPVFKCFK
jgi:DNA ligase-1